MSSRWPDRLRRALGLRLALWYAGIFVASSLALVGLTYLLLAASLREYDREAIDGLLVRSAAALVRGGADAVAREIRTTQAAGPAGPVLVRAMGARRDVLFLSMPERWERVDLSQLPLPPPDGARVWSTFDTGTDTLEVASVRLPDGTVFQVGTSTATRTALLARFRRVLLLVFASLLLVGLAGGAALTWSALQPVRALAATVGGIMRTGRTDVRVPAAGTGDALDELGTLVNAMLDRIDAVISGMRGALDNVAHDLRTPMTRLRGTAETALSATDPAVLRDALADCLEESERVIAMLSTLMDISEAETGVMRLRREPVDLGDLVRQTVDLYEDLADERGLRIETRAGGDLTVAVDRNRLRQVLANLLDNAVKYTPPGGRIELAAARGAGEAVVAVTDTGIGIPADELPRIWERLYRGDKSRSERGLGLGLSFVRAIVEAHGGTVGVRSAPGEGSTFELRLPAGPPDLSPM
jgi:signal transduction histidine kinase